ncbi:MAG: hypothetical protein H3C35_07365 [Bacteroidetes bacterium]|nr:hypothetical protein [Bacteroidota bacterium]
MTIQRFLSMVLLLVTVFFCIGCDLYSTDGNRSSGIANKDGFFYIAERSTTSIIMLDRDLHELKRWNYLSATGDSSIQGIAIDGKNLWLSTAGNADKIIQVDASGDSLILLKAFDAPPQRRGTIRGITWDGSNLWALNNGSSTYGTPPYLYKVNPVSGVVLDSFKLPSPEPRGITFVNPQLDAYGRGPSAGLYYTDIEKDMVYKFLTAFSFFDTAFSTPRPPLGESYKYPTGLTYDGTGFWLINSSNAADHLYRLNDAGKEQARYDLPYASPGEIVWSAVDVRIGEPLRILSLSPSTGARNQSLTVDIFGTGFKPGYNVTVDFGTGVSVSAPQFIDITQLRVNIIIDANAGIGKRTVKVTNPDGKLAIADSAFEVTAAPVSAGYLWLADQNNSTIYKIRIEDTTITRQWNSRDVSAGSAQGLAFDGTNVWLSAAGTDKRLYALDTTAAALAAIRSFSAPAVIGTMRGITFEAGNLWLVISQVTPTNGYLYKINSTTGVVLDSIKTPGAEPRGIVFVNGILHCNDTGLDSVFTYNPGTDSWSGKFATPTPAGGTTASRFATGLTWDGTNFWIANSSGNYDAVYKLSPNGTVLLSLSVPNAGPAQLTGLTYTPN